jgi:hypothetical protein
MEASHSDMCRFNPENPRDRNNYKFVEANVGELYEAAMNKGEVVGISLATISTRPDIADNGTATEIDAEGNDDALLGRLQALRN